MPESLEWGWEDTGPIWAARAFAPKSGQDHLGLGSVSSDRILPALSPGINVLTIHPRYWSFYSWVLDAFWSTNLPRKHSAFRDFYRPREAIYSMACHVCDAPEHTTLVGNIVGSRRISSKAHDATFDPQFDYIKQSLGGYGLYYRSTMELTETIVAASPRNGFPFDAPTREGRALASAFQESVAGTRIEALLAANTNITTRVSRDALVEFGRRACLCQLRVADKHDLPLLRDVLLHFGNPLEAASRSETMRMLLDMCSLHPSEAIGQDQFRQLVYFRCLDGSRYKPRDDLVAVARRWRVYQGREYFSYVFNRLLRWVSRRGLEASADGLTLVPMDELWAHVNESLDNIVDAGGSDPLPPDVHASTPALALREYLTRELDTEATADQVWTRHGHLDEHALFRSCRDRDENDGQTLVALISLLLLLRERFGLPKRGIEYVAEQGLVSEGGSLRIGMSRFMNLLNQHLLTNPNLAELLKWIIEDYVIVQHERVAAAKLPDDTYRLRRVGNALRFFPQEVPADFNDSRFNALSTMVHELGWVSTFREPRRKLTASGRDLLTNGDIPTGAITEAAAKFDLSAVTQ